MANGKWGWMADQATGLPIVGVEEVDLREIWPDERRDFTPVVAAHLSALAQRLGLGLSEPRTEVDIGDFTVDLVAKTSNGGAALIENQLTTSDHRHLGQLLTYAGGRDDFAAGIWIAWRFRAEHRSALDRLNEWSPAEIEFYGVEVAAIRIRDSEVVPDFRPIAFPQNWDRFRRDRITDRSTVDRYRAFFEQYLSELPISEAVRVIDRGRDRCRLQWHGDPTCATYRAQFLRRRQASVALVIEAGSPEESKLVFDQLHERRQEVEDALGTELQWSRQPNRRTSIVRWRGQGDIHGSDADLAETRSWMRESLMQLRVVCSPHLQSVLTRLELEDE